MGILSGSTPVKRAKILNICLFGSFTPFMFSIIKNKNRGLIFFVLNWIAVAAISANSNSNSTQNSESSGATTANAIIGLSLWVILLVAAFKIKPKIKSANANSDTAQDAESDAALSVKNSTSFFDKVSNFANYIFTDYWTLKKLQKDLAKREIFCGQVIQAKDAFERLIASLNLTPSVAKNENQLISVDGCILIEPRKGARVTERSSSSSGRGYAGVRVGRVYVGGSGGSTSQSRSVSYPAPDILQQIDSGRFILTSHRASFAGSMFTKSTEFKKMLDYNSDSTTILIAPRTGSRVWIVKFPSVEYVWLVRAILNAIVDSESQVFDNSATKYGPKISDFIESGFRAKLFEITELIKDEKSGIRTVKGEIAKIQKNRIW